MNFLDGHLFTENQQPLIITAAPYAPSWVPSDFPEDIPVTMAEQVQKAVDCYNAGARCSTCMCASWMARLQAPVQVQRVDCRCA